MPGKEREKIRILKLGLFRKLQVSKLQPTTTTTDEEEDDNNKDDEDFLSVNVWSLPRAFFNSFGWWKPGKDKNISDQSTANCTTAATNNNNSNNNKNNKQQQQQLWS